ncbi:DUF2690 domain-containing protein [Streptomyces sp. NPDC007808]|uniref:DUF2690 domain-containing protein n=1 Tax=Streptomyces sp. NPDC007808 TaxID=3364779 RepID=UPI0036851881
MLTSVCAVVVGALAAAVLMLVPRDGEPRSSLSPPPAANGPRCRGAGCEAESPTRMKCASAPATLAVRRTATGASVDLRYSAECGTSWARMWGTRVGDRIEMSAAGPAGPRRGVRSAEVRNALDADAYVHTPMTAVRPGTVVRVCFRPVAGGEGECVDGRVAE